VSPPRRTRCWTSYEAGRPWRPRARWWKIQPTDHVDARQDAPAKPRPPSQAPLRYSTGVSRAPQAPTASGWPLQPGPRYSHQGSQDQPEKRGLSTPRSPGWRREKHGEVGPVHDPGGADHPRAKNQNHRFAAPRRTPTPTGSRQRRAVLGPDQKASPEGPPCKTPGSSTSRRQGDPG